jgi:hypothetical protein
MIWMVDVMLLYKYRNHSTREEPDPSLDVRILDA